MSSAGDYSRFNKIPGATKAHATHAPHVSLEISKGPTIGPSDPEKGEDEGTAIDVGKRHAATGLFFGCEILLDVRIDLLVGEVGHLGLMLSCCGGLAMVARAAVL